MINQICSTPQCAALWTGAARGDRTVRLPPPITTLLVVVTVVLAAVAAEQQQQS